MAFQARFVTYRVRVMQDVFNIIVQIMKVIAFYLAFNMPVLTCDTGSILTEPTADSGFMQMIKPPPSRPRRN